MLLALSLSPSSSLSLCPSASASAPLWLSPWASPSLPPSSPRGYKTHSRCLGSSGGKWSGEQSKGERTEGAANKIWYVMRHTQQTAIQICFPDCNREIHLFFCSTLQGGQMLGCKLACMCLPHTAPPCFQSYKIWHSQANLNLNQQSVSTTLWPAISMSYFYLPLSLNKFQVIPWEIKLWLRWEACYLNPLLLWSHWMEFQIILLL